MSFDRNQYLASAARARTRDLKPEALQELKTPSGATVKVTQPGLQTWLASGRLPQSLTTESFRHFLQGKLTAEQITDDHIDAIAQFQRDIIVATLVEPRIVPDKAELQPGEIYYRDLSAEDASAILMWGLREQGVARLAAFRDHGRVPAAGADGGEVRPAPKRTRGHARSGDGV